MDTQVIAAMAKWPNVPAVYGWLSLSESGQWRLHPAGDALQFPDAPGEAITSPQILAFIDRNYEADDRGQWYFQNGPQRVYVRLDAAPFIAHTVIDPASARLKLRTHTGLDVRRLDALFVDNQGRLYAATDRGPVLIAGRDLPALLEAVTVTGSHADDPAAGCAGSAAVEDALQRCLEEGAAVQLASSSIEGFPAGGVALRHCPLAMLEEALKFRRRPAPPERT